MVGLTSRVRFTPPGVVTEAMCILDAVFVVSRTQGLGITYNLT
jgi:hypothetical protein